MTTVTERIKDLPQATAMADADWLVLDRGDAGVFKIAVGQVRAIFAISTLSTLGPSGDYEPEGVLLGARPMTYLQASSDGSFTLWFKTTGTLDAQTNTGWIPFAKVLPPA